MLKCQGELEADHKHAYLKILDCHFSRHSPQPRRQIIYLLSAVPTPRLSQVIAKLGCSILVTK